MKIRNPDLEKEIKNTEKFLKDLQTKNAYYWEKRGGDMALKLFKEMSNRVPAYKDFLKINNINPRNIKNSVNTSKISIISKETYLKKYELEKLCWDGSFEEDSWVISATSGSTGEPFYFPRNQEQDLLYALTAELYLLTNFDINKKSTLYINGFAMGVWIGGLFTYQAIKHITEKNKYKISIINPGIDRVEILKAVLRFGKYFDQIIIGGYPPFIKDFVDYSISKKIKWQNYNIKFIFSAEGFSEDFRGYIVKKAHLKNYYKDTLNHYGTVDLGTMSYETPLSILIRKIATKNKKFRELLFGKGQRLPTLTQYIPEHFYFESINNNLICSSYSGLPLFKYNLRDRGKIYKYKEILNIAQVTGINLMKEAEKVKIKDTIWELPFVCVYEREDLSVSFYGANIYPETIKKVLLKKEFNKYLTGKCTLEIKMTKNQNQRLYIHIEGKPEFNKNLKIKEIKYNLKKSIESDLLLENSEYKNNFSIMGKRATPNIVFWSYQDKKCFSCNGKHKWVKK